MKLSIVYIIEIDLEYYLYKISLHYIYVCVYIYSICVSILQTVCVADDPKMYPLYIWCSSITIRHLARYYTRALTLQTSVLSSALPFGAFANYIVIKDGIASVTN